MGWGKFDYVPAEFEDDPDLYVLKPIKYVGIEVWQVCVSIFFCCTFSLFPFSIVIEYLLTRKIAILENLAISEYLNYDTIVIWIFRWRPVQFTTISWFVMTHSMQSKLWKNIWLIIERWAVAFRFCMLFSL